MKLLQYYLSFLHIVSKKFLKDLWKRSITYFIIKEDEGKQTSLHAAGLDYYN